jgi:DNA-3-methyladenine glycosylase I
MTKPKIRCSWSETHELLRSYHDQEWGVPEHGDPKLFEMINLEGAQAGLSWLTVLKKRDTYRKAFDGFNATKISKYTPAKRAALMQDTGIVRNRLKINAVIENAKSYLAIQKEFGSFDQYIWSFTNGKVLKDAKKDQAAEVSERMSRDLKIRGFRFVGPTICYAFMQATGILNDHADTCFRRRAKA